MKNKIKQLTRREKLRRIRNAIKQCGINISHCWSEKRKSGVQRLKYRGWQDRTAHSSIGRANLMGCIFTMFSDAKVETEIDNARGGLIDIIIKTKIS